MNLGSYAPSFTMLPAVAEKRASIFAGSDRPAVLYLSPSGQRKFTYSLVNMRDVTSVCPVFSPAFPDRYD